MSHYATELLARERIADWHSEAIANRLVRANAKGWHGPVGRLTGWLGQVRMAAHRLALGW